VIFVVRKGNPKGIKDWPDLIKPGVAIITPNPKTSGNGYLSFFSAWGSVTMRGGSRQDAINYVTRLYKQVPVLDSGARGASTTFVQKGMGDVHLAWENEAHLEVREAKGELELVYPPISIRAEPHVAVVDDNVDRRKTREAAEAYLKYTYTDAAQEIFAKHFYRPGNPAILKKHATTFPDITLFSITAIAKDWPDAHKLYIGEGGVFDGIYKPR
jgi:sulfate/thiosulfate transport system substrate-binding protein